MSATATETKPNPIAGLNKVQKLAGLLVVLGPEEASVILSAFNQRQMEQIMGEMAKIEFLSADVQQSLLQEFSSVTLDGVTSALGGVEKAQNVLEKSLGATKAMEVLGRVAPQASKSAAIEELRNTPPAVIAQMLRGEQSQTWALVLAQLDAENSVEIFRTMEPIFRGDVMFRMARMEPVSPEVLEMLVKSLLARRPTSGTNQIAANGTLFLTEVMKRFDRQAASDALEMLAKEDPELSAAIRKGMFIFEDVAYGFIPNEAGAAFGLEQLNKLEHFFELRDSRFQKHARFMDKHADVFVKAKLLDEVKTSWICYPVQLRPELGWSRRDLQVHLEDEGIFTRVIFSGNITRHPMMKGVEYRAAPGGFPIADQIMEQGLMLPCHPTMTDEDCEYLYQVLEEWIEKQRRRN